MLTAIDLRSTKTSCTLGPRQSWASIFHSICCKLNQNACPLRCGVVDAMAQTASSRGYAGCRDSVAPCFLRTMNNHSSERDQELLDRQSTRCGAGRGPMLPALACAFRFTRVSAAANAPASSALLWLASPLVIASPYG